MHDIYKFLFTYPLIQDYNTNKNLVLDYPCVGPDINHIRVFFVFPFSNFISICYYIIKHGN